MNKHLQQVYMTVRGKQELIVQWKLAPLKMKPLLMRHIAYQITDVYFLKAATS